MSLFKKSFFSVGIIAICLLLVACGRGETTDDVNNNWYSLGYLILENQSVQVDWVNEEVTSKELKQIEQDLVARDGLNEKKISQTEENITISVTNEGTGGVTTNTYSYQQEKQNYLLTWEKETYTIGEAEKAKAVTKKSPEDSRYYSEEDDVYYDAWYVEDSGLVVYNPEQVTLKENVLTRTAAMAGNEELKLVLADDAQALYLFSFTEKGQSICEEYLSEQAWKESNK